mmetsp:Transcript_83381/g.231410  ORF Transcript_83381/g.231410 Transcript_83381/m.231410 type:complete len:219 (-) Transcript_83381:42-698(-)
MLTAAAVACSPSKPISVAMPFACPSEMPSMMSTGIFTIAVGSAAAMSSMEVPPVLLPIMMGPPLARSMRIAKYFSFLILNFSQSMTVLQGFPVAPVCLVTSVLPSILLAYSAALSLGMMCTPPSKPFSLKWPRPRPPARTCVLMTTSSPLKPFAASAASCGVFATASFGTCTPKSVKTPRDWYSCKLRFRLGSAPSNPWPGDTTRRASRAANMPGKWG